MKELTTPSHLSNNTPSEKFNAVIDNECSDVIRRTVRYVLSANASSYITNDDINDITQAAAERVITKKEMYNPAKCTSFKTWASTVAHNYAIQLSKRIKETKEMSVSISGIVDMSDNISDIELCTVSKAFRGRDSSTTWMRDNLGVNTEMVNADYRISAKEEASAMNNRVLRLQEFLNTGLNDSEKILFEMMRSGLSKTEMMERTGKTGCNIDTSICRLRSKVRNWMKAADYYGH